MHALRRRFRLASDLTAVTTHALHYQRCPLFTRISGLTLAQYLSHPRVTRIIVLENGAVKETGTYEELMGEVGGGFQQLLSSYNESSSASMGMGGGKFTPSAEALAEMADGEKDEGEKGERESGGGSGAGQLMTDELKERETGSVSRSIYLSWAKAAGGYRSIFFILSAYLLTMFVEILARWWLSYWSEHSSSGQIFYLVIYALINLATVFSMFARQLLLYLSSIAASKELFQNLLTTILRAPMSFFDTTPIGRVLNRFSKDMYTIDSQLPTTLRAYLGTLSSVIGTIFVISSVTPWFMLSLLPIGAYYASNQRFFVATYRELRRLDSVSRSPIYALFGETLDGVSTVRGRREANELRRARHLSRTSH